MSSVSNQDGCSAKLYYENFFGTHKPAFDLYITLKTYQNNVDFSSSLTGTYSVSESIFPNPNQLNICNLDLLLCFNDLTQSNKYTTLVGSNNKNNITSIKLTNQDNTTAFYDVEGNFTASFKNSVNTIININGSYKIFITPQK